MGSPGVTKGLKSMVGSIVPRTTVNTIVFEVKPADLPVTVVERGSLESSSNQDVYCLVEGQTAIISIVPEGTKVTKGQLVCELDSAALKDNLTNQVIATKGAEAAYKNAELTRQVAEIAVTEYTEGIYKQEFETVQGEIALAESDLKRAEDRVDWSDRMLEKGYVSLSQNISEKLALQRAKFSLEQAQTKRTVLEKYTKDKTVKELQSEVEKARSDELAKQSTWELEKSKEEKLKRQIVNCNLYAPGDGIVVYANDPNRFGGSSQPQVEEGATVRERQKIFSLPDINKMQVNTKVHESMIDRVTPGLQTRVRVDAFAEEVLPGVVADVAPLPDPSSFFSSDVKVYTTHIRIDRGVNGLRPGMTAQVEILVTQRDDVLSVPVTAVLQYGGKDHVAVRKPDGSFDWREIKLGVSNDKLVEVTDGIKTGDSVALNPIGLMSEEEKREKFGSSAKDAGSKDWGALAKVGTTPVPGAPGAAGAVAGVPGKEGDPAAKGDPAKAKAKTARKGAGGGMPPAFREKFQKISPEDRMKVFTGTPEEKESILKAAGFTPEEITQMSQMGGRGGGGGGGGGGFPGGGGGGGFPGGGGGGGFPGGGRGGAGGPGGGGGGFGGQRGGAGGPGQ